METVYKNVNVYSGAHPGPLNLKGYPTAIVGRVHNIKLSLEDIRTCILEKAVVEEIIGVNQTLRLNLFNYTSDNSIKTTTTTTTNTVATPAATTAKVADTSTTTTQAAQTTTQTTTATVTPAATATDTTKATVASSAKTDTTTTVSASATDKK